MVEPLLGHLGDEERRLGDALLRDEQPRVGEADVEVRAEDGVLAARLSARQEVHRQWLPVVAVWRARVQNC